jgi:tRNA-dihydrouridine synthase
MLIHLGPFQGITDVWYRKAYQQHFYGLDKLYTPFFGGIHSHKSKHFKSAELNPLFNQGKQLVPQLLTNSADELELFALQCKQLGYTEININMGCPWPQVSSKKRGCGLMPYPDMVAKLLDRVNTLPLKVSIKCRLGLHEPYELATLIPIFEQAGISELIVHARTGKQLYKGKAQPALLAETVQHSKLLVVYNGDIFSKSDLHQVKSMMPFLAGIMLGRGLLANPFLPADITGLSTELDNSNRSAIIRKFIASLTEHRLSFQKHAKSIPGPMKELWSYLSHSFENPVQVWKIIRKATSLEDYLKAQEKVFEQFAWKGTGFGMGSDPKQQD